MIIDLTELKLYWDLMQTKEKYVLAKKLDFTGLNKSVEQLITGVESSKELIKKRKELSDEDFYLKLKNFAGIYDWNEEIGIDLVVLCTEGINYK